MRVILFRSTQNAGNETIGDLVAYNEKGKPLIVFKTVELPWKDNASNVSCIPKGIYNAKWSFSPKFRRYTYEVLNVPKRSGIRIHSANYARQLQGCIALGMAHIDIDKDGMLDVVESKRAIATFEAFMQKKPFILEIK